MSCLTVTKSEVATANTENTADTAKTAHPVGPTQQNR